MKSSVSMSESQHFFLNLFPDTLLQTLSGAEKRKRLFDPKTCLEFLIHKSIGQYSFKNCLLGFKIKYDKLKAISLKSGSIWKAVSKLNAEQVKKIAIEFGNKISENFGGRNSVKIDYADGTIIYLEDTESIKSNYPVNFKNNKQIGLPKMRLFLSTCSKSGAIINADISRYLGKGESEMTSIKRTIPNIAKGTILVLDRYYSGLNLCQEMAENNIYFVTRCKERYSSKFLGQCKERFIEFENSKFRLVKIIHQKKGHRIKEMYLMTNLLDQKKYPLEKLSEIYLKRWNIEGDIKNLKENIKNGLLQVRKYENVELMLWSHILAYNIIRSITVKTASLNGTVPRRQSFKLARSLLDYVWNTKFMIKIDKVLNYLKGEQILVRDGRVEPRAIKWENRRYDFLRMCRDEARKFRHGKSRIKSKCKTIWERSC